MAIYPKYFTSTNLSDYSVDTIELAKPFTKESMDEHEVCYICKAVNSVPEEKRRETVQNAYAFHAFAEIKPLSYITGIVIRTLSRIDVTNQPRAVIYALKQLKDDPVNFTEEDPFALSAKFATLLLKVPDNFTFYTQKSARKF